MQETSQECSPPKRKRKKNKKDDNETVTVIEEDVLTPKKTHKQKFIEDILAGSMKYTKPYRMLKMRQRVERVEEIGKAVVSACVDKTKVRNGGMEHIRSDIDLRTDVIMFLGELKLRLEKELKCNFNLHNNVTPLPEEMEEEEKEVGSGVEECGFFKRCEYAGTDQNYSVAVRMLGKLTMTGYTDLRKDLIGELKIPKQWIPSFKKLTANRPKVNGFNLSPTLNVLVTNPPPEKQLNLNSKAEFIQDLEDVGLFVEEGDINDSFLEVPALVPKAAAPAPFDLTAFVGKDMSMKDVMTQFKSSQDPGNIMLSRLEGKYETYFNYLTDQHDKKGFSPSTEKLIVIDSHDGAEHGKTNKDITSIVSFSSKVVSKKV